MKECSIFYLTRSIQTGKDSSSYSICIWCNHIFPALVSSFFKFLSQSLCQRCGIVHQGTPFTIRDLLLMKHGFACKSMSFFSSISWRRGFDSCQSYRNKAFHYDLSCHVLRSSEKHGKSWADIEALMYTQHFGHCAQYF